ncbi:MAG: penicillin-binding protein 2 [Alphaproteobacteria bacterium]|nr:penicillin-binding protein 2 [Alphaproteobacteria bacterium]
MAFREEEHIQSFSRRAIVIGILQFLGLGILASRLAWLQISQGSKYKTLSDKNRINIRMIAPLRGEIVDRFGVPLAVNVQNYRALIVPEQTENLKDSLKKLQKYISLSEEMIERIIKESKKKKKFVPLYVKEDLTWEEVAKIEVNLPDLPGLLIDEGETRNYPYVESTAHVIGYVRAVSQEELTGDPVLTLPGFKVGKTGIEKVFDLDMRGRAGAVQEEVNVHGRAVRELGKKPMESGKRVALSIDGELQRFVQDALSEHKSASAVVMDAYNGAVYAMASHPSFDPNMFVKGIPQDVWQSMLNDPTLPQTNKALAGQYPPGSTFKMITALAGLEAGIINSKTTVNCLGSFKLGRGKFHCWKKHGHGWMNLTTALQQSCDTYFYDMAVEVGIKRISEMAKRFGLGEELGFEIKEEKSGLIPDEEWIASRLGKKWQPGDTVNATIGQGYILATPLQLAVMTARLVNGGFSVRPWITGYVGDKYKGADQWPKIEVSGQYLKMVMNGMDAAVNTKKGTAYSSRILNENVGLMAGKTGTAQVQSITAEQRRLGLQNKDLPWKQRHHALFVGYAPVGKPRYVCSVVVEHGVGGSSAAAPLASKILEHVQIRDPASTRIHSFEISKPHTGKDTENKTFGPFLPLKRTVE